MELEASRVPARTPRSCRPASGARLDEVGTPAPRLMLVPEAEVGETASKPRNDTGEFGRFNAVAGDGEASRIDCSILVRS